MNAAIAVKTSLVSVAIGYVHRSHLTKAEKTKCIEKIKNLPLEGAGHGNLTSLVNFLRLAAQADIEEFLRIALLF